MSYLLEMVKNGKLCSLSLGQNVDQIKEFIFDPNNILQLNEELQIWGYGSSLELYVQKGILNRIVFKYDYFNKIFDLPSIFNIPIETEFDNLNSIDCLINILDEKEIDWEINKNLCDDTTICLSCNDVSTILYCLDSHRIFSIQCDPPPFWIEQNVYWAKKNNRIG